MLFQVKSGYVSVVGGIHKGEFVAVEPCETSKGKAWRWKFKITEGKEAGKIVCELSDGENPPTPANKTGRFLSALASKPLNDGDSIEVAQYVGKPYMLVVEAKPNGKPGETRLTTFSAI